MFDVGLTLVLPPLGDLNPDHPPLAVQETAFAGDHERVALSPYVIEVLFVVKESVGLGTGGVHDRQVGAMSLHDELGTEL